MICNLCGATVDNLHQSLHRNWHDSYEDGLRAKAAVEPEMSRLDQLAEVLRKTVKYWDEDDDAVQAVKALLRFLDEDAHRRLDTDLGMLPDVRKRRIYEVLGFEPGDYSDE